MDRGNKRLEHKVEILEGQNNVCEFIIALYFFTIGESKIDQVISEVVIMLAKQDFERFQTRWCQG